MTNDRSQMTNCAGAKSTIDQQHLSSVICYLSFKRASGEFALSLAQLFKGGAQVS
jgi:hypothetical protein